MIIPSMLRALPLISRLTRISAQRRKQVSGFAGISTDCASAQRMT
jgi:hypothetical protein